MTVDRRCAITSVVLKRPSIFLFDEATSSLDTHTERVIQENLREMSRGATTIVIAHRLSTVMDADEILVLEEGRIVERGTFRQLIDAKGRFAEMWRLQQEERAAEAEAATEGTPATP